MKDKTIFKCNCWCEYVTDWAVAKISNDVKEQKEWSREGMYIWDGLISEMDNLIKTKWDISIMGFKSFKSMKLFMDKLKALKTIISWKENNDGEFVPDYKNWEEGKFFVFYDHRVDKLTTWVVCYSSWTEFTPVYSSRFIATSACEELEKEYLIILWVQD